MRIIFIQKHRYFNKFIQVIALQINKKSLRFFILMPLILLKIVLVMNLVNHQFSYLKIDIRTLFQLVLI